MPRRSFAAQVTDVFIPSGLFDNNHLIQHPTRVSAIRPLALILLLQLYYHPRQLFKNPIAHETIYSETPQATAVNHRLCRHGVQRRAEFWLAATFGIHRLRLAIDTGATE